MTTGKFVLGKGIKKQFKKYGYTDYELEYANKGFILEFFHVPSGKMVQFKAMLTQFEDNYESSWNSEMVYGRNDPIQNFQGTKRTISIGWDLVAASWFEAKDNLQRATLLNSMLYPSYHGVGGGVSTIAAAPIFKLSFANLIRNYGPYGKNSKKQNTETRAQKSNSKTQLDGRMGTAKVSGLVGSIAGFRYAPSIENGFFDPPEEAGRLYPQTIALSCVFTVMHTHTLGWNHGDFSVSNFPYGIDVQNINGSNSKEVMKEVGKSAGTPQHVVAKNNSILNKK